VQSVTRVLDNLRPDRPLKVYKKEQNPGMGVLGACFDEDAMCDVPGRVRLYLI
jgi:hypothetical protein